MAKEKGKAGAQGELDDMKKELEWDEHKIDLPDLIKRYQVQCFSRLIITRPVLVPFFG